jgi:hypothetical protein
MERNHDETTADFFMIEKSLALSPFSKNYRLA